MSFLGGVLGSTLGTATVAIGVNTSQLSTGLAKARGEIESATSATGKLGAAWKAVGPAVTAAAAAGFVALGVAAVKAAVDYENSFTRIDAISNASADQIATWKKQVLSLSGETTVAPKDLADALYFLASAGLDASQVMPVLEGAAKASATGLGSVTDIATLTAQALNAYASSGLTAAQAQDALFVAVKESTAAPADFATALGRVLPIAAAAKVGFDQVVGSLGALSNIGLSVDEGATALRGILQALVSPTSQAAAELNSLGISTDQLRASLQEGGVLGALKLLNTASGGNLDTLRNLIPNVRALTGELGLTGQNADQVAGILDRTKNSAGALGDGFQQFLDGPGTAFKKLGNDLKVALIQVGESLLPIATSLAAVASKLIPLLPLMVKLAGLFLAYKTYAFVATTINGIAASFVGLNTAAVTGVAALTGAATALGTLASFNPAAIAAGLVELGNALTLPAAERDVQAQFDARIAAFVKLHDNIAGLADVGPVIGAVSQSIHDLNDNVDFAAPGQTELGNTTAFLNDQLKAAGSSLVVTQADLQALANGGAGADTVLQAIAGSFAAETTAAGGTSEAITAVAAAHKAAADAATAQKAAEDALVGGVLGIVSGMKALADAQAAVNKLQAHGKQGTAGYKDAVLTLLQSQQSLNQLFTDEAAKMDAAGSSTKQIRSGLLDLGRQAGLTRSDVQSLANDALAALANKANTAKGSVDNLAHSISSLKDKQVNIDIITHYTHTGKLGP